MSEYEGQASCHLGRHDVALLARWGCSWDWDLLAARDDKVPEEYAEMEHVLMSMRWGLDDDAFCTGVSAELNRLGRKPFTTTGRQVKWWMPPAAAVGAELARLALSVESLLGTGVPKGIVFESVSVGGWGRPRFWFEPSDLSAIASIGGGVGLKSRLFAVRS